MAIKSTSRPARTGTTLQRTAWKTNAITLRNFLDKWHTEHGTADPSYKQIIEAKLPGLSNTTAITEAWNNLANLDEEEV